MMTPSELREYEFKGAGRNAYKSDDVDNFFGEVAVAYEKIFRENAELIKRVSLLADRLEQFKQDEEQIKQAVIGAQKAADIIVKEAEMSVEDSKAEAEAILAAAKGEADIIKADAEKQAIADSDLLLSIARDKAEEIINKAKEEAHGILIEANDSAKDTVGAATRTITSESLHYEMLKKEVSEFRASILAQYKTHIELISKLPELAVEEVEKQEAPSETQVNEDVLEEIKSVDPDNDIIEFLDSSEDGEEFALPSFAENEESEDVIKTTLPYDFFGEDNSLEFVENTDEEPEATDIVDFNSAFDSDDGDIEFVSESAEDDASNEAESVIDEEGESEEDETVEPEDIPISRGFSVNADSISNDIDDLSDKNENVKQLNFDSFATIDDDDDEDEIEEEPKKKLGFFRRKK